MARFLKLIIPAALLLGPTQACDPDADDAVLQQISEAIDLENASFEIICDCWDVLLWESRGECLDRQILPSQRRCVEDAYLQDPAAAQTYLDCFIPLMSEMETCLNTKLVCDDLGASVACFDDFDLGAEQCIALPAAIERDLEDCSSAGRETAGSADGGGGPADSGGPSGSEPGDSDSGGAGDDGPPAPSPGPDPMTTGGEDGGEDGDEDGGEDGGEPQPPPSEPGPADTDSGGEPMPGG